MKCLSIQQPWAEAILVDGKDIENRVWYTGIRGRVLVHAGKRPYSGYTKKEIQEWGLVLGALVGTVEIVGCVRHSDSEWFSGPYGFVLKNPVKFEKPIPWPGQLGFFDVPDEIIRLETSDD